MPTKRNVNVVVVRRIPEDQRKEIGHLDKRIKALRNDIKGLGNLSNLQAKTEEAQQELAACRANIMVAQETADGALNNASKEAARIIKEGKEKIKAEHQMIVDFSKETRLKAEKDGELLGEQRIALDDDFNRLTADKVELTERQVVVNNSMTEVANREACLRTEEATLEQKFRNQEAAQSLVAQEQKALEQARLKMETQRAALIEWNKEVDEKHRIAVAEQTRAKALAMEVHMDKQRAMDEQRKAKITEDALELIRNDITKEKERIEGQKDKLVALESHLRRMDEEQTLKATRLLRQEAALVQEKKVLDKARLEIKRMYLDIEQRERTENAREKS